MTRFTTQTMSKAAVAIAAAALVLSACGDAPLQSVGQWSGEWIGPLSEELVFLPSE